MADISKIKLPTGTTYNIKDEQARTDISDIKTKLQGGLKWYGITTTVLHDGDTTTSLVIGGETVTFGPSDTGAVITYGDKEFVWNGSSWQEFGNMGILGPFAYVNSGYGEYTPEGSVSQPTFSNGSISGSGTVTPTGAISVGSGTANYTPGGQITAPTITVNLNKQSISPIDSVGTLPELTTGVANEILTIGWSAGTLPTKATSVEVATGVQNATSTAPSFSGTAVELKFTGDEKTVNVTGTATGTVSRPTFTGTEATILIDPGTPS